LSRTVLPRPHLIVPRESGRMFNTFFRFRLQMQSNTDFENPPFSRVEGSK
jgi:hypothetical protein